MAFDSSGCNALCPQHARHIASSSGPWQRKAANMSWCDAKVSLQKSDQQTHVFGVLSHLRINIDKQIAANSRKRNRKTLSTYPIYTEIRNSSDEQHESISLLLCRVSPCHNPHPLDPEMWGEWPLSGVSGVSPNEVQVFGSQSKVTLRYVSLLKLMGKTIAQTMQWKTWRKSKPWERGSEPLIVTSSHFLNGQGCCFSPSWFIIPNNLWWHFLGKFLWLISYLHIFHKISRI